MFKDYIDNNDLYMFMVEVLCYAILDNQQPIFKQDISLVFFAIMLIPVR